MSLSKLFHFNTTEWWTESLIKALLVRVNDQRQSLKMKPVCARIKVQQQ